MRLFAHLRTCALSAAILTAAAGCVTANPMGLVGTGATSTGGLLALGSVDPNWTITASTDPALASGGPAFVVAPATSNATTVPCCWVGSTPTSQWLNPSGNSQQNFGAYTYTYTTTFTLPNGPTPSTSLVGMASADDTFGIVLNGVSNGVLGYGHYFTWTPFDLTSGFVAGTNTLSFIVSNGTGGPTGLQVQFAGNAVPEPASIALVGIALLGAGVFFRRRITN